MMPDEQSSTGERGETVEELLELLAIIQRMGHRLAYETHGDSYSLVKELNELLHQTRAKIELIKLSSKEG
jgi:organic radical activating enzyme